MIKDNRKSYPDPKTEPDIPSPGGRAGSRQARGLSQRLRQTSSGRPDRKPEGDGDAPVRPASQDETKSPPQRPDASSAPQRAPADRRGQLSREVEEAVSDSREAPRHPDASLDTRVMAGRREKGSSEGLLNVGTQLQGRYRILGVIGVGGMGAVYKAQDMRFPGVTRLCAAKEMINTATDPRVREMITRNFEREASILATLSHPAVPQVYDYFTEGQRSYLVEEFIEGRDLEARVAEAEGFFSEGQVVDWAIQLCEVLSFLHNNKPRPIIFRDLKPSNIMLDINGRIRLVDFGIAKLFQSGEKGTMIGTEGYSPPEQYRGIAEPRGDVYALGATMHHLLSKQDPQLEPPFSFGERPIHGKNPTVSRELVAVIDKALEYDINERWGSADEMRRALVSLSSPTGRGAREAATTSVLRSAGAVKPLWRFACEDEIRGSVTVVDDAVLVPSYDHNVYALDPEAGEFIWKYAAEGGVATAPCVSDGTVVFGSTDGTVYAVGLGTGDLLWTVSTRGRVYSTASSAFDHFFVGSDDGSLYAIHSYSGRKAWTYAADGEVRCRPFVNDQLIVFSCNLGFVYAISLSRDLRWRFRARRSILSSPVLSNGLVFIGSLDWNFYALDIRSGWTAWKYRTGGPVVSSAAVVEDLVIFGSADGNVYALQAADGRVVWRYETGDQVTGSATVHEGAVYIGGVDGALYCLDAQSGMLRWRYQTNGAITGAPQAHDGIIYFGSSDHYVYAIPA